MYSYIGSSDTVAITSCVCLHVSNIAITRSHPGLQYLSHVSYHYTRYHAYPQSLLSFPLATDILVICSIAMARPYPQEVSSRLDQDFQHLKTAYEAVWREVPYTSFVIYNHLVKVLGSWENVLKQYATLESGDG